jgi:outer membrane protein TolC
VRTCIALSIVLLAPVMTYGQTTQELPLTLEECLALALKQNPLVLASMRREVAAQARIRQATARPVPSVDFNSDLQKQPLNVFGTGESYVGISHTFELPAKRSNRGAVAESEFHEIEVDTELLRREITFLVKEAFYGLLLGEEKVTYAEQDLDLAEEYLQKARLKLEAGAVAQVEVLRARVEALRTANAVKVARSEEDLARARLNFLLAQSRNNPLEIQGQLKIPFRELNLAKLYQEALAQRPELKRLNYSIGKEALVQKGARLTSWPDFDVNFSHHYLKEDPTSWSLSLSVPLSFLFRQRQSAQIAEAQANISSLESDLEHMRNTIRLEVEEACTDARTAQDQIALYRNDVLPQAEEVHSMFLFSYQEGEIGGIELIEARKTLNEARKTYAGALYGYAVTLARLDKTTGR